VECLNQAVGHTITSAFKEEPSEDDNSYLESDTDEQLLIHFPFTQAVKVHSLVIQSPKDGSGPRRIKLFVNAPTIGFAEAADSDGTQSFDLTEDSIQEAKPITLRFVKFQNVNCLSLFVESNQNDDETTAIKWIKILGYSGEVMDVSKIKKTEES